MPKGAKEKVKLDGPYGFGPIRTVWTEKLLPVLAEVRITSDNIFYFIPTDNTTVLENGKEVERSNKAMFAEAHTNLQHRADAKNDEMFRRKLSKNPSFKDGSYEYYGMVAFGAFILRNPEVSKHKLAGMFIADKQLADNIPSLAGVSFSSAQDARKGVKSALLTAHTRRERAREKYEAFITDSAMIEKALDVDNPIPTPPTVVNP